MKSHAAQIRTAMYVKIYFLKTAVYSFHLP